MDKVEGKEGRNDGVEIDTLFLGPTRPTMVLGVTYTAFIINIIISVEAFVFTRDLLYLGIALPIHGVFALICWNDPRTFDLIRLWGMTKGWQAILGLVRIGNYRFWKSASLTPMENRSAKKSTRKVIRKNRKNLISILGNGTEGQK